MKEQEQQAGAGKANFLVLRLPAAPAPVTSDRHTGAALTQLP